MRGRIQLVERQLLAAGWTARRGAKHTVWKCPCGKHQTSVPRRGADAPGGAPPGAGPQAEIRRCKRDQNAEGSAA